MASGWSKDGDVQEQIDASVNDAVNRARSRLPQGESVEFCDECGDPIPQKRREAIPGVRICIRCQYEQEKQEQAFAGYNRRGSKDSQLR